MGTSPTQRTLQALRKDGFKCAVVEKWIPIPGGHGRRLDLFNIIDVLAITGAETLGIQCCGSSFSAHWKKLTEAESENTRAWLSNGYRSLEIWSWRKVKLKRGGKAMRWQARMVPIMLTDLEPK